MASARLAAKLAIIFDDLPLNATLAPGKTTRTGIATDVAALLTQGH